MATPRSTHCCASGWRFGWVHCTDADRDAGYRYDLSILQAEFSLTQMFDAPGLGMGRSLAAAAHFEV
ncbi:hypothetical protein [Rhodococcus koreensis]|uniref:hypothetical protein n=1 Tax=Rhodococcus koreensis TaxID=99653 RepID=UPI00367119A6